MFEGRGDSEVGHIDDCTGPLGEGSVWSGQAALALSRNSKAETFLTQYLSKVLLNLMISCTSSCDGVDRS